MTDLFSYDLSSSKTFKKTIERNDNVPIEGDIKFTNYVDGQIVTDPKGYDLVITVYAQDKNHAVNTKKVLGTITIKGGAEEDGIEDDDISIYNGEDLLGAPQDFMPVNDEGYYVYDYANSNKAVTITGSDFPEKFIGGKKADKISTGEGDDIIIAGQGNDTILINGDGAKTIYTKAGDGNDVVSVDKEEADEVSAKIVVDHDAAPTFSYTKTNTDLIINIASGAKTDSITLKDYFGVSSNRQGAYTEGVTIDSNEDATVSLETVLKNYSLDGKSILVNGIKVSDFMKNTSVNDLPIVHKYIDVDSFDVEPTITNVLKYLGIKVPSGLSNFVLYNGSKFNDTFTGNNSKNVMVSYNGTNSFTTGKKGQTAIVSLNMSNIGLPANDTYNIQSFEAGTGIFDWDGKYKMNIEGVNTDDLHMISGSYSGVIPLVNPDGDKLYQIDCLTDTKCLSNLAGIDYKKVLADIGNFREYDLKSVNPILNDLSSTIGKLRGVAVISQIDTTTSYDGYKAFKDIVVNDKKGLEHKITATSQVVNDEMATEALYDFTKYIQDKYKLVSFDVPAPSLDTDPKLARVQNFVNLLGRPERYYITKDDVETQKIPTTLLNTYYEKTWVEVYNEELNSIVVKEAYMLNNKALKEIKGKYFNIFKNSFIGTDGDNKYTVKLSDYVNIASGAGSDTFTLSGNLINNAEFIKGDKHKNAAGKTVQSRERIENVASYNIASTVANTAESDTLTIKNYSFDKNTLLVDEEAMADAFTDNGTSVKFNGLNLTAYDYKKGNFAEISYTLTSDSPIDPYGLDITDNAFNNLTLIDGSKKQFAVTAETGYNDDINNVLKYNWSDNDKANHIALTYSDNVDITSNKGTNIVTADYDEAAKLTYNYVGGNDFVYSYGDYSDDTYNVLFDKKTTLSVYDEGGSDALNITGVTAKDVKLFFNVDAEGSYDSEFSLVANGNLSKKGNFNLAKVDMGTDEEGVTDYEYSAATKNGVRVSGDIETVTIGTADVDIATAMAEISEQVQNWLTTTNTKGYADVDEVINRGTSKEISQVLAIYNNYDLTPVG